MTHRPHLDDQPDNQPKAIAADKTDATSNKLMLTAATIIALLLLAAPAFAHHPLNGMAMETFAHGVASGVGHPVLGFDHLFFVLAMGVAAAFTSVRFKAPGAYIAAMLAACGATYAGFALPMVELMIVASLIVVGGVLMSGRALGAGMAVALFAGFGLFHGSAFGGSIAAQEGGVSAAVLVGYLIGLGVTQYLLAIAAGWAVTKLSTAQGAMLNGRLAGAMVAGVGVFLALEVIEGPIVAAISGS